jgi:hypothetical protein
MPVMRFPVGDRSGFVWDRLHPARVAYSYGISTTCKRTICSVWGAAVPLHATALLWSMCHHDVQHDLCRRPGALFTQEIAIREDADSLHGRATLYALP